jgi:hypothetical protein
MNHELKAVFYNKLQADKIKINWNKNPVRMDLFLSFLTINVERSHEHLGSCTGWTQLYNKDHKLIVRGGVVDGVEYLDSLQYGTKLSNPYNNYVNPFYLFDILTTEGKAFFFEYYADDIDTLVNTEKDGIAIQERRLEHSKRLVQEIEQEIEHLKSECKQQSNEQPKPGND